MIKKMASALSMWARGAFAPSVRGAVAARMLAKKASAAGGKGGKGRASHDDDDDDEGDSDAAGKGKKRPDAAAAPALNVADTEHAMKDIATALTTALSHIRHSSPGQ
jgi:hypothetical protein